MTCLAKVDMTVAGVIYNCKCGEREKRREGERGGIGNFASTFVEGGEERDKRMRGEGGDVVTFFLFVFFVFCFVFYICFLFIYGKF